MKRLLAIAAVFTSGLVLGLFLQGGSPMALAGDGVEKCAAKNGDVNADGTIDLSDPVMVLGFLFLGTPTELVPLCAPQICSGLPDTGQTKCYDQNGEEVPCDGADCLGQDGSYATGCPSEGRFTDNGDGTVTDHCTDLQWQTNTADVNRDGQSTSRDILFWCDALAYCENLSFAGHDDWRLPNVRELQSIVDYGRLIPAIDPVFGAFSAFYWSSTSFAEPPVSAWKVEFSYGSVYGDDLGFSLYVRAVRTVP